MITELRSMYDLKVITTLHSSLFTLNFLRFTFPLYIFVQEHVFTVVHGVGELRYPVAEDDHAGFFRQLQVKFNVAVTVDEEIDVGVILDIFLCKQYEMLASFAHIWRFLVVLTLQPTVLCPLHSKPHAPSRVNGREHHLAKAIVEQPPQQFKFLVGIA